MLYSNRFVLHVVPLVLAAAVGFGACQTNSAAFETCSICQSSRELSNGGETILFRSSRFDHGAHTWEPGLKLADSRPLGLGSVLLLKQVPLGASLPIYGAVIIFSQQTSPERMTYRWYLRSDGSGELDPTNPAVQQGEEKNTSRVKFGPFDLHWSASGDRGAGFVYYERFTHMPVEPHTTFLAATDLTSVVGLNAADARWQYKSSVVE